MADSLPRLYALDILVPIRGTASDAPVVVDLNGARSSLYSTTPLADGNLIERQILVALAEAGSGRIIAPTMRRVPALVDRYSLSGLLKACPKPVGINRMLDAYVPIGPEFALDDEQRTARIARELGVDYTTIIVDWNAERRDFTVSVDDRDTGPLKEFDPQDATIWPYSWDRRIFPFPPAFSRAHSLAHFVLTTNKLLLAAIDAKMRSQGECDLAMPVTQPFGFFSCHGERFSQISEKFGGGSLSVIKPAFGRRSFGVLVVPTSKLPVVAEAIGIVADSSSLRMGARIVAACSLWGCLPEACTVVQPYIYPIMRSHPLTGKLHSTIHRATVLVNQGKIRCLGITCMLSDSPFEAENGRASLLVNNNVSAFCIEPYERDFERVKATAERFVANVESFSEELDGLTEQEVLRWECQTTLQFSDLSTDAAIASTVETAWSSTQSLLSHFSREFSHQ
jgi:hypothetical protein